MTLGTVVVAGVRASGPAGFWLNLVPHLDVPAPLKVVLWPLMFVIEVSGLLIRHTVLAVRLFANMLAGHIVLAVILGFAIQASRGFQYLVAPASVMGVVALSLLELLVAFLQAYIFTFLAALFIGSAAIRRTDPTRGAGGPPAAGRLPRAGAAGPRRPDQADRSDLVLHPPCPPSGILVGVKGPMKFAKSAALAIAVLLVAHASTALAQGPAASSAGASAAPVYPFSNLRALSVGLVIIGAAMGIGGLTRASVESMARQPEMAGDIRGALILAAALIEGVAFFGLIIIGFILGA